MSAFGGSELLAQYHIAVGGDPSEWYRVLENLRSESQRTIEGIKRSAAGGLGDSLKSMTAVVFAPLKALAGVTASVVAGLSAITVAVEAEDKANRRLERSLTALTGDLRGAMAEYDRFADRLSDITGHSENFIKKLGAIGASLTGFSGPALEKLTAASEGFAARFEHLGVGAEEALKMYAAAAKGDFSAFEKLGVSFEGLTTGQEKFAHVMDLGVNGLRDAAKEANTLARSMNKLWAETQTFLASIGQALGLGENAGAMFNWVASQIERLANWVRSLKPEIDRLKDSLKELLGVQEFSELFNADVAILEFKRLFNFLYAELRALTNYLADQLSDMFDSIMPEWAKGMLGVNSDADTAARHGIGTERRKLADYRAELEILEGHNVGPLGLPLERDLEKRKARIAQLHKLIADSLAIIDSLENLLPQTTRRHSDANPALRAEAFAQDAELKRQINQFLTQQRAEIGGAQSAVDSLIAQLIDIPNPEHAGLKLNTGFKPQSVQTAIGDLQIPGLGGARSEKLLESSDKSLKRIVTLLERRPVSSVAII
jgi:hypothetical protein